MDVITYLINHYWEGDHLPNTLIRFSIWHLILVYYDDNQLNKNKKSPYHKAIVFVPISNVSLKIILWYRIN